MRYLGVPFEEVDVFDDSFIQLFCLKYIGLNE